MERARLWWTSRVWWQKAAMLVAVLALAAFPFLQRDADQPDIVGSGVLLPTSTTEVPSTTTTPAPAGTAAPTTTTTVTSPPPTAASLPGPPSGSEPAFIVSVIDGDTVRIQYGSGGDSERLRLIGIDAPEIGDCYADQATAALEDLLSEYEVYVTSDVSERDRFGRLLRYLWLEDGTFVNEELVAGGFAVAREFPPDTFHAGRLASAQDEARNAGRGMWSGTACPSTNEAGA